MNVILKELPEDKFSVLAPAEEGTIRIGTFSRFEPKGNYFFTPAAMSTTGWDATLLRAVSDELDKLNRCAMPTYELVKRAWRNINILRTDHQVGCVTILHDNDEPATREEQAAVVCTGDWTRFEEKRFYGTNVFDALENAVAAFNEATKDDPFKS